MRMLLAVLIVSALAGPARAGDICADDEHGHVDTTANLKALERYARTHKDEPRDPDLEYSAWCLHGDTRHAERIFKACDKILDHDARDRTCWVILSSLGKTMIGKHDVFAWVVAQALDPWEVNPSLPDYPLYLFKDLGDPRGVAVIVDMWKRSIPKAEKKEKRHVGMSDWSGWRQHAAEALAVLGGADEKAFLDEQAKATKDTYVAQACRDAIAAIDKRLAAVK